MKAKSLLTRKASTAQSMPAVGAVAFGTFVSFILMGGCSNGEATEEGQSHGLVVRSLHCNGVEVANGGGVTVRRGESFLVKAEVDATRKPFPSAMMGVGREIPSEFVHVPITFVMYVSDGKHRSGEAVMYYVAFQGEGTFDTRNGIEPVTRETFQASIDAPPRPGEYILAVMPGDVANYKVDEITGGYRPAFFPSIRDIPVTVQ